MKLEFLQLKVGKISVLGISVITATLFVINGCTKDTLQVNPAANTEETSTGGVACKAPVTAFLPCGGFRTQTQGGWGAPARGNNPGTYLKNNFAGAFPNGLIVGRYNRITLTSAQAITNYLPAGGQPGVLTDSYTDPVNLKNNLAAQLVTLTLSVQFDLYDPNFSSSSVALRDLVIASGPFAGKTVTALLVEANNLLGGRTSTYTPAEISDALTSINENFDDGTKNGGFLSCPSSGGGGAYE